MKKGAIRTGIPLLSYTKYRLSAESELLHDISVSLDVLLLEVVKEAASLADQLKKRKTGSIVLLVVLGEPVSVLDFPYFAKISCFFSACKYSAILQKD